MTELERNEEITDYVVVVPTTTTVVDEQSQPMGDELAPAPVAQEEQQTQEVEDECTTTTDELPIAEITDMDDANDATAEAAGDSSVPAENVAATDDTTAASFTPVAEKTTRPRRLKDLDVDMELNGRVTSVALYGIFVDVGVGRDGLVHISEMSDTRIDSPSDLVQIGDSVKVRVKSIDLEARRISLTMRPQREQNDVVVVPQHHHHSDTNKQHRSPPPSRRSEINHDALSNLKVGDTIQGTITGLAPFGAFVDIGVGKDGLVHISELSDGRVEKPEDAVQINQEYTFKVLEIDSEGNRISLSLRRAQRAQKMQNIVPGDELEGTVSGLAPFGAFVDIGVGRDGLVHISQLSNERVDKVEDVVKPGDAVKVRVLEVDSDNKRISLSMREEDPNAPDTTDNADYTSSRHNTMSAETPRTNVSRSEQFRQKEQARRESSSSNRRRGGPSGAPSQDRGRGGRSERDQDRSLSMQQQTTEVYVVQDKEDEVFEGNATLQDLINKFGASPSNRRDRRRRTHEDEMDEEERLDHRKRQREAIRRTLQVDEEATSDY